MLGLMARALLRVAAVPVAAVDVAHQDSEVLTAMPIAEPVVAEALEATGGSDAMMAMHPPEATANLAFREPTAQTGKPHRTKVALKV